MGKTMKKLSLTSKTFVKPAEMTEGQTIKGIFVGSEIDQFDKPNHTVRTTEGDFTLNSAGSLDKLMEQVTPGQYVEITYRGTKTLTSGKYKGKEAHQFEVAASEEIEEIPAPTEAAAPAPKKPSAGLSKVK